MIEDFHNFEPYSLAHDDKEKLLLARMNELTAWHMEHCKEYRDYLNVIGYDGRLLKRLSDVPFIPIRIFKELTMKSIPDDQVFKIMKSSGTSSQKQSRIYLDKETAILQQKVLLRLIGDFVGHKRLPMLVIDTRDIIRDRKLFTTRGATIMGLDFAARKMVFALDSNMELQVDAVNDFLEKYGNEKFLIFGFTYMVWQHLFQKAKELGLHFDMKNGYLLTAGGWKKLVNQHISNEEFKNTGREVCGINHYVDHYGMAEQTGCIYAECECGHLHASIYSDIIIRDFKNFSPCKPGERGFIQVLSSLPHSYPGHSILTEDEGMILGEDDCPCGRKGKYIKVIGRVKNAELRGCSDTYAAEH
ncbi:MAG: acyl-protein synthetase [Lachnospiraceae bacterium]|jgi:phenylacetate-coenzyme A ligase PaaK-like adenylate-forming protein|nr:acyl-protein synthetase [Lachnospiraceae bacterium]MEE3460563.1 acyl-protein synthetase [Lachnospiraceae bacterium]